MKSSFKDYIEVKRRKQVGRICPPVGETGIRTKQQSGKSLGREKVWHNTDVL